MARSAISRAGFYRSGAATKVAATLIAILSTVVLTTMVQSPPSSAVLTPIDMNLGAGPVVSGPVKVHLVFWESHAVDKQFDNYLLRFFTDLKADGLSTLFQPLQWYVGPGINGSPSGAPGPIVSVDSWHDTETPLPQGSLDSKTVHSAVLSELNHASNVRNWSTAAGNIFFIYTGPAYQAQLGLTVPCGWHAYGKDATTGNYVPYAFVPRPSASCFIGDPNPTPSGSSRQDSAVSTSWHELAELLTDPILGSGYSSAQGEVGDVCENPPWPDVTGQNNQNVLLNGDPYLVQGIWSRHAGGCTVTGTPPNIAANWTDFNFGTAPETAVIFTDRAGKGGSVLEVTDAFCPGDRFEIWDDGAELGSTSYVANLGCEYPVNQSDPNLAFANAIWSSGTYYLPRGLNRISIQVIENAGESGDSGTAFYRVSGGTVSAVQAVAIANPGPN